MHTDKLKIKDRTETLSPPTILIISHVIPFPPKAGNEIRILKMLRWLKQEGYRIVLLFNHQFDLKTLDPIRDTVYAVHVIGEEVDPEINSSGFDNTGYSYKKIVVTAEKKIHEFIEFTKSYFRSEADKAWIAERSKVIKWLCPDELIQMTRCLCLKYNPTAVLAEYIFTTPCLDVVPPGTLKIVDTHDMFSRRKEQAIDYGVKDLLYCSPDEERNYLLKSDVIIAIQSIEADMFKQLMPDRTVITTGIDFDVVNDVDNDSVVPGTVLIVGSASPLNVHGLHEFYKQAWPVIRSKKPDAVLRIVGKICDAFEYRDESVQLAGIVDNLDDEYKKAEVVINPVIAGTGLKIKSVEALCKARPLVTTPNGAEGFIFQGAAPFIISQGWSDFAAAVLLLLENAEERLNLQTRALQFIHNKFSTELVYGQLGEKLKSYLNGQYQKIAID